MQPPSEMPNRWRRRIQLDCDAPHEQFEARASSQKRHPGKDFQSGVEMLQRRVLVTVSEDRRNKNRYQMNL